MADFQANKAAFDAAGIRIVAASTDPLEEAQKSVAELGAQFPIAYGLELRNVVETTGAYFEAKKGHFQPAGFIFKPDGMLSEAVFSTGPIGRLTAADALSLIKGRAKAV